MRSRRAAPSSPARAWPTSSGASGRSARSRTARSPSSSTRSATRRSTPRWSRSAACSQQSPRRREVRRDTDAALPAAERRLARCLDRLEEAGVFAAGRVGDSDPLRAIEDALRLYPADEIVVGTHPEERSNWLAHDLVRRAPVRFGLPLFHVVVDLAAHREYVAAA